MKKRKATDEDLSMLRYFWEEKGDIECYCDFGEIKEDLKKNHPHIWKAWKKHKESIKVLNKIL